MKQKKGLPNQVQSPDKTTGDNGASGQGGQSRPPRVINFVGRRYIWYAISLLLVVPGLISFFLNGLNLGIDFTGGNLMQVSFSQSVESEQVRAVLAKADLAKTPVVQTTTSGEFLIRTEELSEEQSDALITALTGELGQMEILRNEKVGAIIGGELARKAILAMSIASVLILLYITLRFEFRFGLAAIVSLLHDALVVIGVFSLFQIEVDSSFVAALLTILGYSINDTIVIFDRIRENRKNYPRLEMVEMVNRSITQTLTRSINTVLTVVFVLVALHFFGGETTKVFTLAMLIGVMSGCYSSIFNASPLWVDFMRMGKNKFRKLNAFARS